MLPSLKSVSFWLFIIALVAGLLSACKRRVYESPSYQVLKSGHPFEIREYPGSTLISTTMQHRGEDGSFMRLFRFISGGNERGQKIAMTVPVLMTGSTSGTMSFVIPGTVARKGVPTPSDPRVIVTTMPAGRYASYRFKGSINPKRSDEAAAKLLNWIHTRKLTAAGTPFFAYYNPPWTPGFLRRNEVLIQVSPTKL